MVESSFRFRSVLFLLSSIAALAILVQGCAIYQSGSRELSSYVRQRADAQGDIAGAYAQSPLEANDKSLPDGTSTQPQVQKRLRDFIVLALERNPDVKAGEETARSKVERIRQVTALPDPFLNMKILPEPVRTAEGDNFFILGVSQKLPVPEKLDRAGRMAVEDTRIALQQWQATRLRVIADVKRAYFQLYVVDRSIDVTQANQDLLRGLIDVARSQLAAGRRSQDDVLRAQVELSNLEAELIALRQRRVTIVARLNEVLDRQPQTEIQPPDEFGIRQVALAIDDLIAKAVDANPDLNRIKHQIERDRESVELAKLAYWPDFALGFEWMSMEPRDAFRPPPNPVTGQRPTVSKMSEDGTDNWAITFGFSLPIWYDKIHGGIEEATRRLAASRAQFRSSQNRVEFAIEDALERVKAQQELARLFRDTIIPQAEQTYHVSQASYTAGTSDFLYVIDNWRKWLVFTIQYYRSMGELERSVADLEQAIGLSLPEVGEP
ncbi:MAG: TolC family protein [Phycisphaerae bacterium]|nr:TolC family protein [Phycisphaerae bacterium]